MKKAWSVLKDISAIVLILLILLVLMLICVVPAFAQDEEPVVVETCLDKKSVSYVGRETISIWKEAGYIVKHDQSQCEYLYCEVVYVDDMGNEAISCDTGTKENGNFNKMFGYDEPEEVEEIPVFVPEIIEDYEPASEFEFSEYSEEPIDLWMFVE